MIFGFALNADVPESYCSCSNCLFSNCIWPFNMEALITALRVQFVSGSSFNSIFAIVSLFELNVQ